MKSIIEENIDVCKDWLNVEIIKTAFEDKKNNSVRYVKIKKVDLLRLALRILDLSEMGI